MGLTSNLINSLKNYLKLAVIYRNVEEFYYYNPSLELIGYDPQFYLHIIQIFYISFQHAHNIVLNFFSTCSLLQHFPDVQDHCTR